jgi:hypothetical protein
MTGGGGPVAYKPGILIKAGHLAMAGFFLAELLKFQVIYHPQTVLYRLSII